ncbi:hypothetical protein KIPB_013747, partial [Kipferlia bialata]|eukprot:g13747.t1
MVYDVVSLFASIYHMSSCSEAEHNVGTEASAGEVALSGGLDVDTLATATDVVDVVEGEVKLADSTVRLGTAPLGPLLFWLCFPTAISMSINALYNLADSYFVGKYAGTEGLTALSLATPLEALFAT